MHFACDKSGKQQQKKMGSEMRAYINDMKGADDTLVCHFNTISTLRLLLLFSRGSCKVNVKLGYFISCTTTIKQFKLNSHKLNHLSMLA